MRSLFDLTPSEARVARGLAVGETLEEIASAGGVAITTVRSQLRQVLEKTGCTRQAEVVSLLANVTLDRSAAERTSRIVATFSIAVFINLEDDALSPAARNVARDRSCHRSPSRRPSIVSILPPARWMRRGNIR